MLPSKDDLRKKWKQARINWRDLERTTAEQRICDEAVALCQAVSGRLATSKSTCRYVALYAPFRGEVDLTKAMGAWQREGWHIAFPRTGIYGQMDMCEVSGLDELQSGRYGILEPSLDASVVAPSRIGIMFVPGLAFTTSGVRLGYGGGYYDRYLPQLSSAAHIVGVCFSQQVTEALPQAAHDVLMHQLVTDRGVVHCRIDI